MTYSKAIKLSGIPELAVGSSLKFFHNHPPGSDEWNLRITNPGLADSGTYECQINTEPKKSCLYHVDVVISKVSSICVYTTILSHDINSRQKFMETVMFLFKKAVTLI